MDESSPSACGEMREEQDAESKNETAGRPGESCCVTSRPHLSRVPREHAGERSKNPDSEDFSL